MAKFVIPGPSDRTVIMGQNGTGKTIMGAWILSKQNFDKRPWVAMDFKDEILWDQVGDPPMRPLRLGQMPGKSGLYRLSVNPGDEDELEEWLWKVWKHGNIGLFADEFSLVPQRRAMKAILRQGRSKIIPVIGCTQRPVDCDRELFTEAQYRCSFGLEDERDYQVIRGLFGGRDVKEASRTLPRHWSLWYDTKQKAMMTLRPCPPPATVAAELRAKVPYRWFLGA